MKPSKKSIKEHVPLRLLALSGFLLLSPLFAFAQEGDDPSLDGVESFVEQIGDIFNIALPILITLAVLAFFWGLAKFIWSAGDQGGRDEGKSIMLWGVIALFIMVSIWGIVRLLGNIFDVDQGTTIAVPGVADSASGGGVGGGNNGGGNNNNGPGTLPTTLPQFPATSGF